MKREYTKRIVVLLSLTVTVLAMFALRLRQWQIVQGAELREKADTTSSDRIAVTAARGEILDRNGLPLVTNRIGFIVSLNRAYLAPNKLNETLLKLIGILQQSEERWADSTPMAATPPYTFLTGPEGSEAAASAAAAVAKLKERLGLNIYATEQNVMDKMVERYQLKDTVPPELWRTIGGIRYEMERREYGYGNPFPLATDVSTKTVSIIKEHSMDLAGVDILTEAIRQYPDTTLMPHVLGTIGPIYKEEYEGLKNQGYKMSDLVGKSGLERAIEQQLKGKDGEMQLQRNRRGEVLSESVVQQPQPGSTVVLTIDKKLQEVAQKSLADMIAHMQKNLRKKEGGDADAGAAVVIEVKTGAILAMATYPSYDSREYENYLADPMKPLFNRAVQGLYRPGSTFKPSVATAGLIKGAITPETRINCDGVYHYWEDTGFRPKCTAAHGNITVDVAIQKSCNIFFYETGRRLGLETFNQIAAQYGMGESTGIEIPEQKGTLTHKEKSPNWQEGNVVQAAIGQMDTAVTPLQLAVYASTIANRGVRYKAHLIKSTRPFNDTSAASAAEVKPEVLSRMEASAEVFATVEKGMLQASTEINAGQILGNYPMKIATKSGTAQIPNDLYNAVIIAYGPVPNPEIAVAVVVEKGFNGYRLAQVVRDIFDAYYPENVQKAQSAAAAASGAPSAAVSAPPSRPAQP